MPYLEPALQVVLSLLSPQRIIGSLNFSSVNTRLFRLLSLLSPLSLCLIEIISIYIFIINKYISLFTSSGRDKSDKTLKPLILLGF